jgi:hypothetical protein
VTVSVYMPSGSVEDKPVKLNVTVADSVVFNTPESGVTSSHADDQLAIQSSAIGPSLVKI